MKEQRRPVETSLGIISGRDAIYLDELRQAYDTLSASGEINTTLCSNCPEPDKWIKYKLQFMHLLAYRAWGLNYYPSELDSASSFDIVPGSAWARDLGGPERVHYVLSTYDYVYEILAEDFKLDLGEIRGD